MLVHLGTNQGKLQAPSLGKYHPQWKNAVPKLLPYSVRLLWIALFLIFMVPLVVGNPDILKIFNVSIQDLAS